MRRLLTYSLVGVAGFFGLLSCDANDISESTKRQAACMGVSAFSAAGSTSNEATRAGLNKAAEFLENNSPENTSLIHSIRDLGSASNDASHEVKNRVIQEANQAIGC